MLKHSAYGFRHDDHSILTLDSIGWQEIDSHGYNFASDDRPDAGHVIFQYTLSGQGVLEYEQKRIALPQGSGFLLKIPSASRYYYVEQPEPWEVLWINLRGEEASRIWDIVMKQEGPVIWRDPDSPLIQGLWKLLRTVAEDKVTDKYRLSVSVYEWMLTLVRTSQAAGKELTNKSSALIEKAKRLMREQYALPHTLDSIAEHLEINKYHFCRLFQKSEQTSPLAYLRDRRVEAAIALLRTTDLPIQEIGQRCGFESPSYFGKVFRAYMSLTPTEYRLRELEFPYDAIYYE
ncbi:AraC-like DNA-binding protein [Paenibacillus phyllosphaerae]|uniref:AraC-like DNA-binding protein n=1 Tax=Paenibacillus phyllosphaerae TaxID=274593 RepID=A0A7W5FQI0_9BACL|nr:AraC family transcriptional regulator [Paenibacillus phyllosphaerae]MBB3113054.1 AraC-like DNA-binding protein [Paenibacillus phyllosphaerae]